MSMTAECQRKECSGIDHDCNSKSRQAAIDVLDALCDRECEYSKKQRSVMCGVWVEQLPSAQPEIMRCGNCKHYYFTDNRIPREQWYTCELDGERWRRPDDYCSFVVRRTDEEAD